MRKTITLSILGFLLVITSAAFLSQHTRPTSADSQPFLRDRILIVLSENNGNLTSFSDAQTKLSATVNIAPEHFKPTFNTTAPEFSRFITLNIGAENNADEVLTKLRNRSDVTDAGYDSILKSTATIPNDPSFNLQWGLYNTGQTVNGDSGVADKDIDAELAWDLHTGANDVVVAVVDTGLRFTHEEFSNNRYWTNSGEVGAGKETDGIDNDGNGFIDDWRGWDFIGASAASPVEDNNPTDTGNGHGTHIAGIIGAETNNGKGVAGVNWQAQIMAVKALDDSTNGEGTISTVSDGILYAALNGADVINLSLGSDPNNPPSSAGIATLQAAVDYAYNKNVVVVAAAGNNSTDLTVKKVYPVCNDGGANKVLGVAATDNNDARVPSSNYGACVDVGSPGQNIYSSYNATDNSYGYLNGTSQAAAFASGTSALVRSYNSILSNAGIILRIKSGADNIGVSGIGSGRLNAYRTLNYATPLLQLNQTPIQGSGYTVYYLEAGKKRGFSTSRTFATWTSTRYIHKLSDAQIADYTSDSVMGFRDGTLIKSSTASAVYVIEDGLKRNFTSADVFLNLNYKWSNILNVSDKELALHTNGAPISSTEIIPNDTLVKGSGAAVYYIENGKKRPFKSYNLFKTWGTWDDVHLISDTKLNSIPLDSPMGFRDGYLIKGSTAAVYVIEDGLKRPFSSGTIFYQLGYSFSNVLNVSDTDLTRNVTGDKI